MDIDLFERAFHHIGLVPILLFIIWRSGEPRSRFGLVSPKYPKDLLIGVGLWFILAILDGVIDAIMGRHDPWFQFTRADAPQTRLVLLVGWSCAVGLSEELATRAYLIPRLEMIIRSTWKSVLIGALFFGFVHLSQSYVGIVRQFLTACLFGWAFCVTRRIWPVAIAHAVVDFVIAVHSTPISGF